MAAAHDFEALLSQMGSKLRFAGDDDRPRPLTLGWRELDDALPDGGLPRGIVELSAPGKLGGATSVALAAVRAAQARGPSAWCAWVDPEATLHAPGLVAAGVDLSRMLVVRPPRALLGKVGVKLVSAGAFEVVVVDVDAIAGSAERRDPPPGRQGRQEKKDFSRIHPLALRAPWRFSSLVLEAGRPSCSFESSRWRPSPAGPRCCCSRTRRSRARRRGRWRCGSSCRGPTRDRWRCASPRIEGGAWGSRARCRSCRSRSGCRTSSRGEPCAASPASPCPRIRLEVVPTEPHAPPGPIAVVVARPGASVKTERDILGNTRLDVVSSAARTLGVRAGQTVAAARARCADLRVRVVAEGSVQAALARLAEAALAFGPATSFDVAQDVVWVDVGGCAHLHGGERALAQALEARVESLGHRCRVAVANGPRLSSAVARFAVSRRPGPLVVPPGSEAAAMRVLPVAALALDESTALWLQNLGMARCGDLQKLPRRSFGTRLAARAHDVMQLLDGEDRAPLDPYRPAEVPEERVELEWGAASVEALTFILKSLCDRLAARLQGRAMGAARLELVLSLDRALCREAAHLTCFRSRCPCRSRARPICSRWCARASSTTRSSLPRCRSRYGRPSSRACRAARSTCSSPSRWPTAPCRAWWPSCRPSWVPTAWGCSSSSIRGRPTSARAWRRSGRGP